MTGNPEVEPRSQPQRALALLNAAVFTNSFTVVASSKSILMTCFCSTLEQWRVNDHYGEVLLIRSALRRFTPICVEREHDRVHAHHRVVAFSMEPEFFENPNRSCILRVGKSAQAVNVKLIEGFADPRERCLCRQTLAPVLLH